jgi:HEPN domain-containing protein
MSVAGQVEDPKKTPYINDFASRCFRDVADEDYLAARAAFRSDLIFPILTNGHQALEKYLKAILLYNRRSSKNVGHDLEKALAAVKAIPDIKFDFPPRVEETIKYFEDYGRSRYFEVSYHKRGDACLRLDHAVWSIRRYCRYLRAVLPDGTSMRDKTVAMLQAKQTLDAPHKYRIVGGYLEKILDQQVSRPKARELLVWKNFYYGGRHRQIIKKYKNSWSAANSPLSMHPEIYDDVKKLVKFTNEFDDAMTKWIAAGTP